MKLIFVSLLLLVPWSINAQTVTWLRVDAPPFSLSQDEKQQGICEAIIDSVIAQTPQFDHQILTLPQVRLRSYFEQGQNVCTPCLIKREDNSNVRFSISTNVYPPLRVITTSLKQKKLVTKYTVPLRLELLLSDKEFRYGQSRGRKYTPWIQNLIHNIKGDDTVTFNYRATDQAAALGDMLINDRIDYGIDYPFIADHYNQLKGINVLTSTTISGTEDDVILGAIGCAQTAPNDFAQNFLETINPILLNKILPSEKYMNNQKNWVGDYFDNFEQLYDHHILNKKPATSAGLSH